MSGWQLPDDPLRSSAALTKTVGLIGVLSLALIARAALDLTVWYPVKAVGAFGGIMLLAIGYLRAHHGGSRFGSANQMTTARAGLAVLVTALIGEAGTPPVAHAAAAVSLVVALLDGVDGWLARRAGMVSAFGARFDTEIDALLIQALAILAWRYGKAGPWVIMSGLLRYLFVASGWLWPWMRRTLTPSLRGRAICVVQIAALILAILPAVEPPASDAVAAAGLVTLGYSFLVDTVRLWRHEGLDRHERARTR